MTPSNPCPTTADYEVAVRTGRFDGLFEQDGLVGMIETVQQDGDLAIVNVAVDPDCQG